MTDPSVEEWKMAIARPLSAWENDLYGVLDQVGATMTSRHQKYGPGNIARHGMTGIKVRLGDKYERLESSGLDYEDESLRDTFLDLIGYAIIGIMWLDKTWPGSEDK